MEPHDLAAMKRAITLERARGARERQAIDDRLREQSWHEVGQFASWCCQDRAMRLRPYDCPPCRIKSTDPNDSSDDWGWRPSEIALLRKLLDAGISRYHPDPIGALEEAKNKRVA
jgi:hypothetical protein